MTSSAIPGSPVTSSAAAGSDVSPAASISQIARRAMIDSQLRPSGVNEPWVLAAMARLPREDFVPEPARPAAYMDRAVPLGGGRFLAPPLVHGRMLGEAGPLAADTALVVSAGSGYLAELLRPLVGSLVVIEPAAAGAPIAGGPFSLIIVDGAAEELPATLTDALAQGGRLVTGLIERGISRLAIGNRSGEHIALLPLSEIAIPPIAEFAAPRRWTF